MESSAIMGREIRGGRWQFPLLVTYGALLTWVAVHHEPWFDEAQAWLLVRDLDLWDLLVHWLRYEGHPSLLYLWLYPFVKLGLPFRYAGLTAVLPALAGAWIVWRHAPFPVVMRIAIPFGFFPFYQYGVLARDYMFLAPLLFGTATCYPGRKENLRRWFLLLVLLAHSSLHGTVLAVAFLAIDGIERVREDGFRFDLRWWAGTAVFSMTLVLMALQLWVPADAVVARGAVEKSLLSHVSAALTESPWFSLALMAVVLVWLDRRRSLLLLLIPWAGLIIVGSMVFKVWHEGVLVLSLLAAVWLAWKRDVVRPDGMVSVWVHRGMVGMLTAMLMLHVYWAGTAAVREIRGAYSGTRDLAEFLKLKGVTGTEVYMVGFTAVGALPYMERNVFSNHNHGQMPAFWQWRQSNPMIFDILHKDNVVRYLKRIRALRPAMVVVDARFKRNVPVLGLLKRMGYRVIHVAEGKNFWKTGVYRNEFYVVFEKVDSVESGTRRSGGNRRASPGEGS